MRLFSGQDQLTAGALKAPFFPRINSEAGITLLEKMKEMREAEGGRNTVGTPVIVHHFCALHMFKARLERKNFELRRRRRAVAERVIAVSGLNIEPLGSDSAGREYWKLPGSQALFVCSNIPADPDKQIFPRCRKMATKQSIATAVRARLKPGFHGERERDSHVWSMCSDGDSIQCIIAAMPVDHPLRTRLQEAFETYNVPTSAEKDKEKPTSPCSCSCSCSSTVSTIKEEKQSAEIFSTASASTPNVPLPRVALSDEDTNKEVSLKAEADTDLKADIVTKPPNVDLPDTVTTSGSDTPAVVKIEEESSMDVVETAPSETSQIGDVKDSMPSDVKDPSKECVSAASNEVPGGNLERVKRLSSSGLSASDEATPAMPSLPENQPVEMRFAPGKGTIPQPFTVINEESAFEQKSAFLAEAYDDDGPEDLSYEEYFTFSGRGRRYMVLQLVNSAQKEGENGS